jgi:DNA-binding LytR/AlgR family response regulator
MALKTLIVDDEPVARRVLREELETVGGVDVVAEADNGPLAVELIDKYRPDLVLLDLQMPGMSGLEVVRSIQHGVHLPSIVIVTAYDEYALQAFEAGAIDYLLKPAGHERLSQAVERARRLTSRETVDRLAQLQEIPERPSAAPPKRIVGKAGDEYFILNAEEILGFHADGDLVWIISGKRKFLALQTLKVLEQRLQNTSFRRIHRNALVNVNHVKKMSALSSQRWLITMSNDQEFIASKRQARSVRELLSW